MKWVDVMKYINFKSIVLAIMITVFVVGGCMHPLQQNWKAYRAAKKRGDYTAARKYLADDARIWFEKKEGLGKPLTAKGGPYRYWDKEFRAKTSREKVHVVDGTVTYLSSEINDFYRLIERIPTKARITYYFNDENKISGMLYQGFSPRSKRPPDRYDEFKQWMKNKYPGMLESPEMKIPNQPKRWRELLTEWRAETGLPPI